MQWVQSCQLHWCSLKDLGHANGVHRGQTWVSRTQWSLLLARVHLQACNLTACYIWCLFCLHNCKQGSKLSLKSCSSYPQVHLGHSDGFITSKVVFIVSVCRNSALNSSMSSVYWHPCKSGNVLVLWSYSPFIAAVSQRVFNLNKPS